MNKEELREVMRKKRRELSPEFIKKASDNISDALINLSCIKNAKHITVYLSAFKEPDTFSLIEKLLSDGKRISVPVSNTDTFTITPSLIKSLDRLKKGTYGISEPKEIISVPIDKIDVALIPGIAFSDSGDRLGFGKGYYDRFLEEFKGVKIGVGYDFQIIDAIPVSEHDIGMDMIVTEKRIYNDF